MESINIQEYIDMLKRRKFLIIAIVLVGLIFGGYKMYRNYVSYVPRYTSSVTIRINSAKKQQEEAQKNKNKDKDEDTEQESGSVDSNYYNYSTAAMDQNIATTYSSLVSETPVTEIAAIAGVDVDKVLQPISATQRESIPQFIDIRVTSSDAQSAQKIANAMPEAYNNKLISLVGIDCVQVVYEASQGTIIPRSKDTSIIKYGMAGLVVAIFLVLLLECLNTKIITPDDVEKYWDLPLLGVIPMEDGKKKGKHSIQKK